MSPGPVAGELATVIRLNLGVICRHQAELWRCTDLATEIMLLANRKSVALLRLCACLIFQRCCRLFAAFQKSSCWPGLLADIYGIMVCA